MSRGDRVEFKGGTFHVFGRGNRKQRVFLDDEDYGAFVGDLRLLCGAHDAILLAYCLMPNHYHLCMRTDGDPLSVVMHRLNTRHALRFNRKYRLVGHLNQGRFKSVIVHDDRQLLSLIRYLHRNPVEAGIVHSVGAWPHCSHSWYLGAQDRPAAIELVLARFGGTEAYAQFMNTADADAAQRNPADVAQSLLRETPRWVGDSFWLGSPIALSEAVRPARRSSHLARRVQPPRLIDEAAKAWANTAGSDLATLRSRVNDANLRRVRADLVRHLFVEGYLVREIAELLNRGSPAVSRLLDRVLRNGATRFRDGTANEALT